MAREILDFGTQGLRNARKSEDVSELRNGPTTTRLHQKKLIAPIFEFFGLNRRPREQTIQPQEKILILELRARETPEKLKMCLN
jgi:hypothetical protein